MKDENKVVAELILSTETAIGIASAIVVTLTTAIGVLFRLGIAHYDAQLIEIRADRDYWRKYAHDATDKLERIVNIRRAEVGGPPFEVIAPIVAEHFSPTTNKQQTAADQGTLKARLVAVTKELGLPPTD